jgi:hypothetical protein
VQERTLARIGPSRAVLAGKACARSVAVAKARRESGFTLLT